MIQGVFCHESGCPNANKVWDGEAWVRVWICPMCGEEAPEGFECCGTDDFPEPADIEETGR
jgi:hypothetical protein